MTLISSSPISLKCHPLQQTYWTQTSPLAMNHMMKTLSLSQDQNHIVTSKNATTSAAIVQSLTEEDKKVGYEISDAEDSDEEEKSLAKVCVQLKKKKASK